MKSKSYLLYVIPVVCGVISSLLLIVAIKNYYFLILPVPVDVSTALFVFISQTATLVTIHLINKYRTSLKKLFLFGVQMVFWLIITFLIVDIFDRGIQLKMNFKLLVMLIGFISVISVFNGLIVYYTLKSKKRNEKDLIDS